MSSPRISRRSLLAAGAAGVASAGLAAAAPGSVPALEAPGRRAPARRARNVIFLVSDGASMGTITLAESAARRQGRSTHWCRLWGEPGARRAAVATGAADSMVTDSAAGGSAWGIGRKVNNGSVNVLPDGSSPAPIQVLGKRAGMRAGLVTTTRLTDATPASFAANAPKRSMEDAIGAQLLEHGIDVLLGGGGRHFRAADLERARATVVRTATELAAVEPSPSAGSGALVGLFADGSMSFEIDRTDVQPSLAAMSAAALRRLAALTDGAAQGFLLQIEGGRVDHAAHGNDAAALVRDQLAFDEALGVALAFAKERGDTLVIVTTDHGNANPGLTLYGKNGDGGFARLLAAKHSFEWILQRLGGLRDPAESADDLPAAVRAASGVDLSSEEVAWMRRAMVEKHTVNGFSAADSVESALGAVLANHFGVAFLSVNHTSDLVDCVAWGPGAERLEPLVENTALHGVMRAALELE